MSNQDANKVEFTYAIEITEGVTMIEVKKEVEINKNTKEESRMKYQYNDDDNVSRCITILIR